MGSGASAETARTTVAHMLTNKPADASDIKVKKITRIELSRVKVTIYNCRTWSKREQRFEICVKSHEIFRINFEVSQY